MTLKHATPQTNQTNKQPTKRTPPAPTEIMAEHKRLAEADHDKALVARTAAAAKLPTLAPLGSAVVPMPAHSSVVTDVSRI